MNTIEEWQALWISSCRDWHDKKIKDATLAELADTVTSQINKIRLDTNWSKKRTGRKGQ